MNYIDAMRMELGKGLRKAALLPVKILTLEMLKETARRRSKWDSYHI